MYSKDIVEIIPIVKEDILIVKLNEKRHQDETCWKVDIIFERSVIKSWNYSQEEIFALHMKKSGRYLVRVQVKCKQSVLPFVQKSVRYYDELVKKSYKEFIEGIDIKKLEKNNKLELFCPSEPYQNVALVCLENLKNIFDEKFEDLNNFDKHLKINYICALGGGRGLKKLFLYHKCQY